MWDDEKGYLKFPYREFDYAYQENPHGNLLTLNGKRVQKVTEWDSQSSTVYESDLPKETRILTDLYLDNDEPSEGHRVVVLDIEVSDEDGFPNIEEADKEILSIALEDKLAEQEYVWFLDEERNYDDLEIDSIVAFSCYSEEDLLDSFLTKWEEIQPTIATGWNCDRFDIPYLYKRIKFVLGPKEANRLSPIGLVNYSELRTKYRIAGVSVLDYLKLYKKFTYKELPNYRLDTVGKIEVDLGKVDYDGTIVDLFRNDIEKAVRYNINDVRIVSKLDQKLKFLELVRGVCSIGHVPYEDYGFSSRWLEGALVIDSHRQGLIVPNKNLDSREKFEKMKASGKKGFAGAYVKMPVVGRHEWIYSLDLKSLYPSIIMSLNISPETKAGKIVNWDVALHLTKKLTEYVVEDLEGTQSVLTPKQFQSFMQDSRFTISSNGILYRTDKTGLIPKVLDRWFADRLKFQRNLQKAVEEGDKEQKEYWTTRQHIQKIFLNSLYGVLGLPIFRFYDVDNALAVTTTGQDVIKASEKFVNLYYNKELNTTNEDYCLYIDTDSLYFSVKPILEIHKDKSPEELAKQIAEQQEHNLNEFYNRMAPIMFFAPADRHRFMIKGEKIAVAGFWVQKKRYALLETYNLETKESIEKVTVKGLDVVRSTFPTAFRSFMKDLLKDILQFKSKKEIDEKILKFRMSMPQMSIPDVARNTAVKNITKWLLPNQQLVKFESGAPAHVKASITYNLLLKKFKVDKVYPPIRDGQKIKWVYVKDNPYQIDAIAFFGDGSDAPQIVSFIKKYIDYNRLFQTEFSHKLQDFYSALKWGRIPTETNQKASQFFDFGS